MAEDDVDNLRQFVDRIFPQIPPNPCDPVVPAKDQRLAAGVRLRYMQAAEFVDVEAAAVLPGPGLPEEYRPSTIELDDERDDGEQNRQRDEQQGGNDKVAGAFQDRANR
jgi:hypothetical protein